MHTFIQGGQDSLYALCEHHINIHIYIYVYTYIYIYTRMYIHKTDLAGLFPVKKRHTYIYIYRHCNPLQHAATHCNTRPSRQNSTPCIVQSLCKRHCNTPQHAATHCNTLQHAATRCNTRPREQDPAWSDLFCKRVTPHTLCVCGVLFKSNVTLF